MQNRHGATVVELVVVVAILIGFAAIALPRFRDALDRSASRGAMQEAASLFSFARRSAISRRAVVGVVMDTASATVIVRIGALELGRRNLRARYGVRLATTRDSMSYDPRGLGYGAANLTIIASRGRGAETLFVSRLGRTRR